MMDASNGNTLLDMFNGDLVAGSLTAGQSTAPLTAIAVILSDDSPDDKRRGCGRCFSHEVQITSRDFDTGRETGLYLAGGGSGPARSGRSSSVGSGVRAFWLPTVRSGSSSTTTSTTPGYVGPDPTTIVGVDFNYVLANDFKVEIWSDRQTGLRGAPPPPLTRRGD